MDKHNEVLKKFAREAQHLLEFKEHLGSALFSYLIKNESFDKFKNDEQIIGILKFIEFANIYADEQLTEPRAYKGLSFADALELTTKLTEAE